MKNELQKNQKVVILADGIELWMDEEKADALVAILDKLTFDDNVNWEGRNFTKSMYRGTFLPSDIEDQKRRKNGQWLCKGSNWHDRFDKCECASVEEKNRTAQREAAIKACKKCHNGFIEHVDDYGRGSIMHCDCWAAFRTVEN